MGETLKNVYYSLAHPAGFGSPSQLSKHAPIKDVKKWLQTQRTYTLHKQRRKRMPAYRRYRSPFAGYQFQADLNDLPTIRKDNKSYRYILTVIDIFSRYAYAKPLKTKTGKEMIIVFKSIFKHMTPHFLQTDDGTEFKNRLFQTYLQKMGVVHFSVKGDYKACIVERFNRTLKSRMFKYFTFKNTRNWVAVLPQLIESYNNRPHRALSGYTPNQALSIEHEYEIWKNQQQQQQHQRQQKIRFQVGDQVRLSLLKRVFKKGYLPNWTEEVFTIKDIDTRAQPPMYIVNDEIEGKFYADELQKVSVDLYPIERVYKRQGNKHLVKFLSYPGRYWVSNIHKQ